VRASIWTAVGYGAGQLLRLASNLVLSRLLFPEAFGLMALVSVFMQGLQMFSDIGITPSIVQNRRGDDPVFLDTAWTLQVIRGWALWIFACIGAWPFAVFYGEPELALMLPVSGLAAAIAGFNSTSLATLSRHLAVSRLTMLELAGQASSVAVMIASALIWPSVWSLVAGGLASAAVKCGLSHAWISPRRHAFRLDAASRRELIRFGKWIFVTTVLTFFASQADRLILGKLLTIEMLGVYSIAFMLTDAPRKMLKRVGAMVLFPAVSRRAHLPREELRGRLLAHRRPLLFLMAACIALLAGLGDLVVLSLWDDRYAEAAWMTSILALGLWLGVLTASAGPSLMSLGEPRYNAFGSIGRLAWISTAAVVAYGLFGLGGVVVVVALADLPNYISVSIGLRRERLSMVAQDAQCTVFLALMLALVICARAAMSFGLPWEGARF
jgi:O-antigen/teichoic acid export membrane protein